MIKFDKPQNLNGVELIEELETASIKVNDFPLIDANGDFWLDIAEKDATKAVAIIAAHNGTTTAPDFAAQRKAILDRLGITAEEAALLLA